MAGTLNSVQIIGNLTRDPETRETNSGTSLVNFGIATSRNWKDKDGEKHEEAEFHNVVAWAKLAEIIAQYLHKGSKVFIRGRLQTSSWDDKDTGKKMYRTEIVAEDMIMLDKKGGDQDAKPKSNEDDLPEM